MLKTLVAERLEAAAEEIVSAAERKSQHSSGGSTHINKHLVRLLCMTDEG